MNINQTKTLESLYFQFHDMPGWLSILQQHFSLTHEQIQYIEEFDDVMSPSETAVSSFANSVDEMFFADSDSERIKILETKIKNTEAYNDHVERESLSFVNFLVKSEIEEIDSMRKQLQALKRKYEPLTKSQDEFEQMLRRARQTPLESIVELDRANRVLCPFHDDKNPSMYVKNGFGYCFSCGESCDPIKWVMKTSNLNFKDAVRSLQ